MKKHLDFSDGHKIPIIGLGMWQANDKEELKHILDIALDAGYRHFDTASGYGNEDVLGEAIKRWTSEGKVKREELFIVTKLPMIGMKEELVEVFLKASLASLQLDYVDLYLIHQPMGLAYHGSVNDLYPMKDGKLDLDLTTNLKGVWRGMEKQVDAGRAKSIGISNFNERQVERIASSSRIPPANLQIEMNVYCQQKQLRKVCRKHGITVCAYAPFGSPGRSELYEFFKQKFCDPQILEDPTVLKIAKRHSKTPSQVLLRFIIQNDVIVIPKSTNPERVKLNIDIFNFDLDASDMEALDGLDKGAAGSTFDLFYTLNGAEAHPENPRYQK